MNLTQNMKPKEEPKDVDSDDDYDDKFKIYDTSDEVNIEKEYVDLHDNMKNLNDIIKIGEKYSSLIIENNKIKKEEEEKKENKKDKKRKSIKKRVLSTFIFLAMVEGYILKSLSCYNS